jgi:probable rRNA maturation factor
MSSRRPGNPLGAISPQRPKLMIEVRSEGRAGHAYVKYIQSNVRAAGALLRSHLRELSIVLVGNRRMSGLHERFLRISGPTDVLTFPIEYDARGRPTSGEVVICVPEARRRARQLGNDLRDELLLYALHGMLHLSGFDDRTDRDSRRMHRTEDTILRRLRVGPVFDPTAALPRSSRAGRGRAKGLARP